MVEKYTENTRAGHIQPSSNGGLFISLLAHLASTWHPKASGAELQVIINELVQERDKIKEMRKLHLRLGSLRMTSTGAETKKVVTTDGMTREDEVAADYSMPPQPPAPSPSSAVEELSQAEEKLQETQHAILRLTDERSSLQMRLQWIEELATQQPKESGDVLSKIQEELSHIIQLWENLEASLLQKDLISELRLQVDEVVAKLHYWWWLQLLYWQSYEHVYFLTSLFLCPDVNSSL